MSADPIIPEVIPMPGLMAHKGAQLVGRQELRNYETPEGTATHKPIPHHEIVQVLIETLGLRRLTVIRDQYAVTPDGLRMFGVLSVDVEDKGVRVCLGLRNSHDKSFALALTVGFTVFICDNLAFAGDFQPVLKKHSPKTDLIETIALGVERCQRGFAPLFRQIDAWQGYELTDDAARLIIYKAVVERAGIELPRHLAPKIHDYYFDPKFDEFRPRTKWSLHNAFTSAIGELDAIPRFQATAKLGPFFEQFH